MLDQNRVQDRMQNRTDRILNCVLILSAVFFLAGLIRWERDFKARPVHEISKGDRVQLRGVDFSGQNRTVILVLQKGCRFCSESATFYRRLVHSTSGYNVHLMAVLPQTPDEGRRYLRSLDVPIGDVRQATFRAVGVAGTPTIILADNKGIAEKVWIGELPPRKEAEVLQALQGTSVSSSSLRSSSR